MSNGLNLSIKRRFKIHVIHAALLQLQTVTAVKKKREVFNRMFSRQAEWREEVKRHFEKIKSEGTCLHRLDEELINRRREELRSCLFIFYINFSDYSAIHDPIIY